MVPLNFNLSKALICVVCGIVFAVFLVLVLSQIGHNVTDHEFTVIQSKNQSRDKDNDKKDLKVNVKPIDGCCEKEKDQEGNPEKDGNVIPNSSVVTGTDSYPEIVSKTDSSPEILAKTDLNSEIEPKTVSSPEILPKSDSNPTIATRQNPSLKNATSINASNPMNVTGTNSFQKFVNESDPNSNPKSDPISDPISDPNSDPISDPNIEPIEEIQNRQIEPPGPLLQTPKTKIDPIENWTNLKKPKSK